MTYIDAMQPDLSAFPCTERDNGDGTRSYQKPNGKWLSLLVTTPGGPWGEADSIGPWEQFRKETAGGWLVLDLEWDGKRYTFRRSYGEA